jgi:hypothetical protein
MWELVLCSFADYRRDPNLRNALKRREGLAGMAPEAPKFKRNPHMAHFGQYKNSLIILAYSSQSVLPQLLVAGPSAAEQAV